MPYTFSFLPFPVFITQMLNDMFKPFQKVRKGGRKHRSKREVMGKRKGKNRGSQESSANRCNGILCFLKKHAVHILHYKKLIIERVLKMKHFNDSNKRNLHHCLLIPENNTSVIVQTKKSSIRWCLGTHKGALPFSYTAIQSRNFLKPDLLGATCSYH